MRNSSLDEAFKREDPLSSSQLKPTSSYYSSSSNSYIISFGNNEVKKFEYDLALKPKTKLVNNNNYLKSWPSRKIHEGIEIVRRTPYHAYYHTIAERMRREKISQHFIALSALIPGLKKMDKASVLEDTIKYVKHLEEQVKQLEEQSKSKGTESVVCVKKSQPADQDHECDVADSSSNNLCDSTNCDDCSITKLSLPEVETRVSEKSVLIRIRCEKKQNAELANIVQEIEKLHLSVVNSNALIFGSSVLLNHRRPDG